MHCHCFDFGGNDLQAIKAPSGPTDGHGSNEKQGTEFRPVRRRLWIWFVEVTIFRVLVCNSVVLPGMPESSTALRVKMASTVKGQITAAEEFSKHLKDSCVDSGSGHHGFGQYAIRAATSCNTNSNAVDTVEVRSTPIQEHL
jgi:hypothetical protein